MTPANMIRSAVLLLLIIGCGATPDRGAHQGKTEQRFTSMEAVLLDFELDGHLIVAANIIDPIPLIKTQLLYTVGQLNGERAVGRYERLEVSSISIRAAGSDQSEVTYHARLPVAWGLPSIPRTYGLTVPSQVAEEDQLRFASRYGTSCVDESAPTVDAGSMFLFYRPQRPGCALASEDVVSLSATVKTSDDNTKGKYPEYQRIWEDGALDVVTIFSRAEEGSNAEDVGLRAHDAFIVWAEQYLLALQPNDAERRMTRTTTSTTPTTKLAATLRDGRAITIDVMLVGHRIDEDEAGFARWYDRLTPTADLILYNGHAALGDNVRTLLTMGSFRPKQYAILSLNGCDTLAYVDRTLADRRALLNPDDPRGTKYMDVVSNVMNGYFETAPDLPITFIEATMAAGDRSETSKTYDAILASIDPNQVVVVTGEEDNEFEPQRAAPQSSPSHTAPSDQPKLSAPAARPERAGGTGCDAGGRDSDCNGVLLLLIGFASIVARRRGHLLAHRW